MATKVIVGSYVLLSQTHDLHPGEEALVLHVTPRHDTAEMYSEVYDVVTSDGHEATATDDEISYTRTAAGGVWQHVDL